MKDRIKRSAEKLFVRNGFAAVSFADIAADTGTTTANIHYHFRNKLGLAEALLEESAELVLSRYESIFISTESSLRSKMGAALSFNKERYRQFNDRDEGGPWSLITRFRLDAPLLDERARLLLNQVSARIDALVATAVSIAVASGELSKETPGKDVSLMLISLLRFNQYVVTDAGRFAALEHLYAAVINTVEAAYGINHRA